MKRFLRIFFTIGLILATGFGLNGCTLAQSTLAGATSGWWGRTGDDDYDPTKIAPVYCYNSLGGAECYATPLPEGTRRRLIGEQHPYKNAKQLAADKDKENGAGGDNNAAPVAQTNAAVPQAAADGQQDGGFIQPQDIGQNPDQTGIGGDNGAAVNAAPQNTAPPAQNAAKPAAKPAKKKKLPQDKGAAQPNSNGNSQ